MPHGETHTAYIAEQQHAFAQFFVCRHATSGNAVCSSICRIRVRMCVCVCVCVCAAFSLYDIDGDGVINGTELQTTLASLTGKAYTPTQLEQVRARLYVYVYVCACMCQA